MNKSVRAIVAKTICWCHWQTFKSVGLSQSLGQDHQLDCNASMIPQPNVEI